MTEQIINPLCPYFGKCGGCTSQHIPYTLQLENKKKMLATSTRFPEDQVKVFSGSEYYYRNRMDFIFHERGLGFREKEKWQRIIDIEKCVISEHKINLLLKEARDFFGNANLTNANPDNRLDVFDIRKKIGTFRYAVIRTSQTSSAISFVLNEDSSRLADAVELIRKFAEHSIAENIVVTYVPADSDTSISSESFAVKGNDYLEESYCGKIFQYSVQGFFQNNHSMAEELQKYVNGLIDAHNSNELNTLDYHLLDLYGGVGTFGIINAPYFKGVTSVESFAECTLAAKKNIELNNIANTTVTAICLDAKNLKKLDLPKDLFVITDPPRSGMHPDTIFELNKRKPKVIIYISCNIQQLSKDLPKFFGYEMKSVALFDLFPQTPHAEGVVELVLKEKKTNSDLN